MDKEDNRELSFLTETPYGGEIFFDEFNDPDREWRVMLYDVLNPEIRKSGTTKYLVFIGRLLKGFNPEEYNLDLKYKIYFSYVAFKRAWLRARRDRLHLNEYKMYDCVMTFKRPNRMKMDIVYLRFNEVMV